MVSSYEVGKEGSEEFVTCNGGRPIRLSSAPKEVLKQIKRKKRHQKKKGCRKCSTDSRERRVTVQR